ncbi:small ribosomal subunit protein mS37-like [Ptychodera flava]|uniref:small ribosomal subunit protein mS37-like n=1 Tax=Ptychodera flava TaxID=63121 RepID=UPI00396A3DB9
MPSPRHLLWKARMAVPANRYTPKVAVSKKPILENFVSNRSNTRGDAPCIQEMSVLMTCWKNHDYNDADCVEEITAFQKCAAEAEKKRKIMMEAVKAGKVQSGKLPSKQVNTLLRRNPQPAVISETS